MSAVNHRIRWALPIVLLVVWLAVGGITGPYAGKLGEVATNDNAAFLPQSAESTRVAAEQLAFQRNESVPAVVVWTADEGRINPAQYVAAGLVLRRLAGYPGVAGPTSPVLRSKDGVALQAVVPLAANLGDGLADVVRTVRRAAERVNGTTAHVAGPAAVQADLKDAFAGIDGILLVVALVVVLVILLLVYRSILLPFAVILSAVFALGLACAIVYALAQHGVVRVDSQVQGILSILVIGAATDYALLLTARFREELDRFQDRFAAMRSAVRRSFAPISASAATVALALLALLISDLTNNQALGPVGAIGIGCALLTELTFLPAVLLLLGPAAYWPAKRRAAVAVDDPGTDGRGIWARVGRLVDGSPRRVWSIALAGLVVCAAFSPLLTARGVPLDEIFIQDTPSVAAQRAVSAHFPGGSGNPAWIIARADRAAEVTAAAVRTDGVASAAPVSAGGRPGAPPQVLDGRVRIAAVLDAPADSDVATRTVQRLRTAVHAVDGADALVGGYTARQYDTQTTAAHDRALIIPLVLSIILVILVVLLRSLLAPVLLVATVGLNFLATLGISALVFHNVFGFSGADASVPLYGFVFLVALGVDYNIFLMTRVREESMRRGTRFGVLKGLTATGGVITSAGVVLAATFAALSVIPLAFLAQIAFIVAFGVLLDTLVVRSLLVPALARDLGGAIWWPNRLPADSGRE